MGRIITIYPRHKRRTCLRLLKKKPQNAPLDFVMAAVSLPTGGHLIQESVIVCNCRLPKQE